MPRLLLLLCLLPFQTSAERVVVLGDSWGALAEDAFRTLLVKEQSELIEDNIAVQGTTTVDWVTTEYINRMTEAVSRPGVRLVWVSLMGNDVIASFASCHAQNVTLGECILQTKELVIPNMRLLFAKIRQTAPEVDIVGFGYDILSYGEGCAQSIASVVPQCGSDVACFNQNTAILIQEIWDELAGSYPYVRSVNLLGTLQHSGGIPGAQRGQPNTTTFSPPEFFHDCLHPNQVGFDRLLIHLYRLVFAKYEPGVLTPSPFTPCVMKGANVTEKLSSGACVATSCNAGYTLSYVECVDDEDDDKTLVIVIAVSCGAAAMILFLVVLVWCCCFRRRVSIHDLHNNVNNNNNKAPRGGGSGGAGGGGAGGAAGGSRPNLLHQNSGHNLPNPASPQAAGTNIL